MKYPPNISIIELEKLAAIWNIRVWSAATHKRKAEIIVNIQTFEKMFNQKPKKGAMEVPDVLRYFIDSMYIMDITDV